MEYCRNSMWSPKRRVTSAPSAGPCQLDLKERRWYDSSAEHHHEAQARGQPYHHPARHKRQEQPERHEHQAVKEQLVDHDVALVGVHQLVLHEVADLGWDQVAQQGKLGCDDHRVWLAHTVDIELEGTTIIGDDHLV